MKRRKTLHISFVTKLVTANYGSSFVITSNKDLYLLEIVLPLQVVTYENDLIEVIGRRFKL